MHPIEAPNDNFRLLIRQASALCVLVHSLYIALFVWAQVNALAGLNVASVLTHCTASGCRAPTATSGPHPWC